MTVVDCRKKKIGTLQQSPLTPSSVVAPSTELYLSYSVDGATTIEVIADRTIVKYIGEGVRPDI